MMKVCNYVMLQMVMVEIHMWGELDIFLPTVPVLKALPPSDLCLCMCVSSGLLDRVPFFSLCVRHLLVLYFH